MPEHSPAQKQYLLRVQREKISDSRVQNPSVPGLSDFMGGVCPYRRWIDSFIFSSPSEIWITFS